MDMDDDPSIIQEPPPTVTLLSGNESEADAATLAAGCWLLQRYSSYTYIARAYELFRGVVDAFTAWPQAAERLPSDILRDWTQELHDHQAAYERGLALLKRGHLAAAYAAVAQAAADLEPQDPRDERHLPLSQLLDDLGPAAAIWSQRASAMARRIDYTLKATWAYETILADRLSLHMRPLRLPDPLPTIPLPDPNGPVIKTGQKVPQTGIWIPATIRNGCPNFLINGEAAPLMNRACERIDHAVWYGPDGELIEPAWSDYEFTTEPTVWCLLWADQRYRGQGIVDEPAFLDEDNALPQQVVQANKA